MKMPIEEMMKIIEDSICQFNNRQIETESIRKTFVSAGQHPWKDCKEEFKAHLDRLSFLPLYGGCKSIVEGLEMETFQSNIGLRLDGGLEETEVEEMAVEEVAAGTAEVVELSLEEQAGAC